MKDHLVGGGLISGRTHLKAICLSEGDMFYSFGDLQTQSNLFILCISVTNLRHPRFSLIRHGLSSKSDRVSLVATHRNAAWMAFMGQFQTGVHYRSSLQYLSSCHRNESKEPSASASVCQGSPCTCWFLWMLEVCPSELKCLSRTLSWSNGSCRTFCPRSLHI